MTTDQTTHRRSSRRVEWSLSAVPWVAIALAGSLLVRARLVLGDWPQPSQPDPKDIASFHQGITLLALPLAVAATFALVMVGLFKLGTGRAETVRPLWLGLIGLMLLSLVFSGDVGTWIVD